MRRTYDKLIATIPGRPCTAGLRACIGERTPFAQPRIG